MDVLPDSLLLRIFSYLEHEELVQITRVNKKWYRIAFDWRLWKQINLNHYESPMSDWSLRKMIKFKVSPQLRCIRLHNFHISTRTLSMLSKYCPHLQDLAMENVIIHKTYFTSGSVVCYFPERLRRLNMLGSSAPKEVYKSLARCLAPNTLEEFAAGSDFFRTINLTQTFMKLFLRQRLSLKLVNFASCDAMTDQLLTFLILCCRNLEAISLRNCRKIDGTFLRVIFAVPTTIKALDLQSLNIRDELLTPLNWTDSLITELDLSWCRPITSTGLLATIPYMKFLRSLELFLCGFGRALTDEVVARMASQRMECLEVLDISYSYTIGNEKTREMLLNSPKLKCIRMHHCPQLTPSLVFKDIPHLFDVEIYATFAHHPDDVSPESPVPYINISQEIEMRKVRKDIPFKNYDIRKEMFT